MGDNPKAISNSTQNSTQSLTPYAGSQGAIKSLLSAANGISFDPSLTSGEQAAFRGLQSSAKGISNTFLDPLKQSALGLLDGGGFGQGLDELKSAYETATSAYTPIAQGQYLDQNNPYLQQLISQSSNAARNAVGAQFAGAGRPGGAYASPGQSAAVAKAVTEATAPLLFSQYNRERDAQQNAAGQIFNSGLGYANALDQSQGNRVNAQLAAPGLVNAAAGVGAAPYEAQLYGQQYQRGLQQDARSALQDKARLILPIATGFGTSTGQSAGQAVQEQGTNPYQTALGSGLGLLGLLSMGPTGGLGGALGSSMGGLLGGMFGR